EKERWQRQKSHAADGAGDEQERLVAGAPVDVVRGEEGRQGEADRLDEPRKADLHVRGVQLRQQDRQHGRTLEEGEPAPEGGGVQHQDREVPAKMAGGEDRRPLARSLLVWKGARLYGRRSPERAMRVCLRG